jgi:hypothetical protein
MLTAIRGLFKGIRQVKGYRSDVDAVYDYDPASSDQIADNVSIGVFTQNYRNDGQLTRISPRLETMATLIVGCRGRIRGDAKSADPAKDNLIADMDFVLWSNMNLGIQTNAIRLVSADFTNEGVYPSGTGGYAQFSCQLTYSFVNCPTSSN